MESPRQWLPVSGFEAERAAAERQRARDLAAVELRAAIAFVARDLAYRVLLCGMATDARLVAELDEVAADAGVVLERRIRGGGGLDVVVRSRGDGAIR
jgi:hypothetical protein